ncbi:DNA mismatch repair protein MutS [Halalkaliarchaeum desulfuricum]|uniref:DNA mismatch repair protein MutS n=1 Tax=Halalkaliarchaeum desulfuricum TaxID=2055893 RepID=A0A343TK24_9EURY|nr:DNA mismatch repair protein MutS [Halalkaliarchaeum desulfuricum]AUX09446.1 DNA mismatch repair protein MutS [Halalkaliarchaeum desulfuricum]
MTDGIVGEFLSLKEETDADLLAMQCGDFYEFFAEDAEFVGRELDLKVSQKSSHGSSYPMAGVPLSELSPYLKALVEKGYRVAVADQYETDGGGHAREITKVVTPGTFLGTHDADAQYLAAIVADREATDSGDRSAETDTAYGLAFADVTTGRFTATAVEDRDAARAELHRFGPAEVIPGPAVRTDEPMLSAIREETDATLSLPEAELFAPGRARHAVREQFGSSTPEAIGLESTLAIRAAGAVVGYAEETGAGVTAAMTRLQAYEPGDHVALDATTQRNLELAETMQGNREGSLFATVDHTVTTPGRRLLREWLARPRRDRAEIGRRLDAVEAFASAALARDQVRDVLGEAADLERLGSRAANGSADARDLLSVRDTLAVPHRLLEAIDGTELEASPIAETLRGLDLETVRGVRKELAEALAEDPPDSVTQGGLFRRGYDEELDEVIERHEAVREWLDGLADRERKRHGLSHVTVDRNKTDGYYIQVGKSVADRVPEHYREVKTLKNSKRFTTDELEEREREVLRLEEARGDLEHELFCELRERVAGRAELLQDVGRAIAAVDVFAALAEHAAVNGWTRPTVTDGDELSIEAGRHPVVEQSTEFVPNDLAMDERRRFLLVTGPNMSGKSTYMRQAALIALLAQAGSFVPAREATVGVVDGIYTRVGALDELAEGRSTFMVEMQELSNILHSATENSLVILDEVGRGTATYDGISIAWAATEYLHNEIGAKTLFATHYHELTTLAEHLPRVENVHVAAEERDGDVTFLRTIREGPTDRSYGIHVADLAGVPEPVVSRADEVLGRLREEKAIEARGSGGGSDESGDGREQEATEPIQAVFDLSSGSFRSGDGGSGRSDDDHELDGRTAVADREDIPELPPGADDVLEELSETDVNETPPVELMAKVQEWQERIDGERNSEIDGERNGEIDGSEGTLER